MENNSSEIGERINELMFRLKINQRGLGEKIGVSHTTVRNVVNNITKPRYEFLESILNAYPNINKDWLLGGTGEMFLDNKSNPVSSPKVPELWQELKHQYEERIKELEAFKFLYLKEKGVPNFNDPTTGETEVMEETEVIRMYTDAELLLIQNPKKLAIC